MPKLVLFNFVEVDISRFHLFSQIISMLVGQVAQWSWYVPATLMVVLLRLSEKISLFLGQNQFFFLENGDR